MINSNTMFKTNFFKSSVITLFCMVILGSCDENSATAKSNEAKIISFQILRKNNASLPSDVTAKIDEDKKELSLTFPFSVDLKTKLIPSFKLSEGASVLRMGGIQLVSEKTQVDFSSIKNSVHTEYTVHAESGVMESYTVKVEKAASSAKEITSYEFLVSANAILGNDIAATIDNAKKSISIEVPIGTNVTALKATFTTTGKQVKIGDDLQQSGVTANDFSSPKTYTVYAQDGTTQVYTVTVTVLTSSASSDKGYRNVGFKYFYYSKDRKIYYTSSGDIYKMDLDGGNSTKIKDHPSGTKGDYIYVYNDIVYFTYESTSSKKIVKMNLDGTGYANFISPGEGVMKVYDDRLYYFVTSRLNNKSLYSFPLDQSDVSSKIVDGYHKYVGVQYGFDTNGDYHVKGGNLYYHEGGDGLWKVDLSTKTKTKLSSGLYDNYTFTRDYIYCRYHNSVYGIGRADYSMQNFRVYRDTDKQVEDRFALNVSSSWILYYNRTGGGASSKDLNYVSKDGTSEKVLVPNLKKVKGDFKIIGDWAYYMLEDGDDWVIYRVKKDGTSKAEVKRIDKP